MTSNTTIDRRSALSLGAAAVLVTGCAPAHASNPEAATLRAAINDLIHEMRNQGADVKAGRSIALEEYADRLEGVIGTPSTPDARAEAKAEIARIRQELADPDEDLVTAAVFRRDEVLADRLAKALEALS